MAVKRNVVKPELEKQDVEQVQEEQPIWWRKIGGGSLRFNGKIIKPTEKFQAKASEIPKSFRNVIVPLENIPTPGKPTILVAPKKPLFKLESIKNEELDSAFDSEKEYFNVVNGAGKKINQMPLEKEKAEDLIKELEA